MSTNKERRSLGGSLSKIGRPRKDAKPVVARTRIRFWPLAAAKQARENRKITPSVVIKETGLPRSAIFRAAKGELKEIPIAVLDGLSSYFGVEPGELLERIPEAELEAQKDKADNASTQGSDGDEEF